MNNINYAKIVSNWRLLLWLSLGILSPILIGKVLFYSGYGFDFTDESFYLTWITSPFNYGSTITNFGFIYHLLYKLLDQNLLILRQANVLLTVALASILSYQVLQRSGPWVKPNRIGHMLIASGIGISALTTFNSGLLTPNYNTLDFQGLIITSIGLLLHRKTVIAASIVGLGGFLTFMAKPSSALLLGIMCILYLSIAKQLSFKFLFTAIAVSSLLLYAFAIYADGSFLVFINHLQEGVDNARILSPEQYGILKIIRFDQLKLSNPVKTYFYLFVPTLTLASIFLAVKSNVLNLAGCCIASVLFIIGLSLQTHTLTHPFLQDRMVGMLFLAVPISCLMTVIAVTKQAFVRSYTRADMAMILFFLVLPYIFAVGTGNNYWAHAGKAAFFWALSGLIVIKPILLSRQQNTLAFIFPAVLFTQILTALVINKYIEYPYRQPQPLYKNTIRVSFPNAENRLIFSKEAATLKDKLRKLAYDAEFKPGTPLIDLTGRTPGAAIILEAEPIGAPWLSGGSRGSENYVQKLLSKVPDEKLERSWLLVESDNIRKIPSTLLLPLGLDIKTHYKLVGSLEIDSVNKSLGKKRILKLYKPLIR